MLLVDARRRGSLRGIVVADLCYITHILFVEDIMLLCDGSQ